MTIPDRPENPLKARDVLNVAGKYLKSVWGRYNLIDWMTLVASIAAVVTFLIWAGDMVTRKIYEGWTTTIIPECGIDVSMSDAHGGRPLLYYKGITIRAESNQAEKMRPLITIPEEATIYDWSMVSSGLSKDEMEEYLSRLRALKRNISGASGILPPLPDLPAKSVTLLAGLIRDTSSNT